MRGGVVLRPIIGDSPSHSTDDVIEKLDPDRSGRATLTRFDSVLVEASKDSSALHCQAWDLRKHLSASGTDQAPDEAAFEDGTLNFLSIPDVQFGLDWLDGIGVELVGTRVRCLTGWFLRRLTALRHSDGSPMVEVYGPLDTRSRGGTVAFNLLDRDGRVVDERLVATESSAAGISLRTGCFCNPGVGEDAFGLSPDTLRDLRRTRTRTLDEYLELIGLPSAGAVRVSFGLASTVADVERFVTFAEHTFRNRRTDAAGLPPRDRC